MPQVLVTGAAGQIGSELTCALRDRYGNNRVIASDIRSTKDIGVGPFEFIDVTDAVVLARVIDEYQVDVVYHLAAILSATGEERPELCWQVNMDGLRNVLELARSRKLQVFCPSSIAVFGERTPAQHTPQDTILSPSTMYGITKVSGELLAEYYFNRYHVDVRGVRYPGIISHVTLPGGGTTDYAVDIYYHAVDQGRYTSFLDRDTILPMMYMPDAIRAAIMLMEADATILSRPVGYNITAMSFSVEELANEIKRHVPHFAVDYQPDFRQAIADSWPQTIDDSLARLDWHWQPEYDLSTMTNDMLAALNRRKESGNLYYG